MTCKDEKPDRYCEITPRTADEIEHDAAVWLIRVDLYRSPERMQALEAWLQASPRHKAAYMRLRNAWRRADVLRRMAMPGSEPDPDLLA